MCDVIEDILSFREYPDVSLPQIQKIVSDFCRKIETDEQLVHRVALLEVENNVVRLPKDLSIILQVAYKGEKPKHTAPRGRVTKWIQNTYDGSGCEYKITLDCPECHKEECDHRGSYVTIDVDDLWRDQHPEYQYMHMDHLYRWGGMNKDNIPLSPINQEFHLIKYAQHAFHNADYHIKGCLNLDAQLMSNVTTEYTINNGVLKLNREGGEVLIPYMAQHLDEQGYHLIPDIPEVIEGIKWYFEELTSYKDFRRTSSQADITAFKLAHAERIRLQGVINEILQTPSYTAWMAFLANRWKRPLKDNNYFGNMNANSPNNYERVMTNLTRK